MMEIFIFYISKKILKLNAINSFIMMKKKCYDFLDFVDMSSNSLFNNPDEAFDHSTLGSYGYSLSLFESILDNFPKAFLTSLMLFFKSLSKVF